MSNLDERRKNSNIIDKLDGSEAERVGLEIGKKAGEILKKAEEELNKIFNIYGLQIKTAIQITDTKTGKVHDPVSF